MGNKRYIVSALVIILSVFAQVGPLTHSVSAEISGWDAGHIISDSIFTNTNSMSTGQIQQFLDSKVPVCDTYGTQPSEYGGGTRSQWAQAHYGQSTFTCLKSYVENGKSAAQIIYDVSQQFQINPQVLIVLLQKEQGVITDVWPLDIQYRTATGYGCPDTAPCDSQYYGLTNQLTWSGRMFRAILNNSPTWYTPYVLGNNYIQYNPNASCGGSVVNIVNRSTQALYNYTPYQPNNGALNAGWGTAPCGAYGNRNFVLYFQSWFGSTKDGRCLGGYSGNVADVVFRKINRVDYADFVIYSGSSTGCVESHLWDSGFTSWKQHITTSQPSVDFPNVQLIYGDLDGDKNDYPVFFSVKNSGTGTIEAHLLERSQLRKFLVHTGSNTPTIDPATSNVRIAKLNRTGKEGPILVQYQNTGSGMVELHEWGDTMMSWRSHTATSQPVIDPVDNSVMFGDIDGDGKDEAVLIGMRNTGSGRVEFHIWDPGQQTWKSHVASNMPAIDPANSKIAFADIDGDGKDEAVLIGMKGTGSGRIEFHVWNQDFSGWRFNIASNQQTPQ